MSTIVETREYQQQILEILKSFFPEKHAIVELDCGLGKRVLTYLILKQWFNAYRVLILLHSTTSYLETIHYFKEEYGDLKGFAYFSSRNPGRMRESILRNESNQFIAATPQTFANTFNKMANKPHFDIVLINEVDKIVRRQSQHNRTLIFPYNTLIPFFLEHKTWLIGLTGTIRDNHILYNPQLDKLSIQSELVTLDNNIPRLRLIQMDTLMRKSDVKEYIQKTTIKKHNVTPDTPTQQILETINEIISSLREEIIEKTLEENPSLISDIDKSQLPMVAGMVGGEESPKYQGLLLIRKYVTAMQPHRYKRFLYRLKEYGITKELIMAIPQIPAKILELNKIIINYKDKIVILCSYINTARDIEESTTKMGLPTFVITGQVKNKSKILESFKSIQSKAVLIMTSVGERDIDIPQAKLLLVYDVVNTSKTMYQRFKRTRGGEVRCLCYGDTFEERKVDRLFDNILKRYPWSIIN